MGKAKKSKKGGLRYDPLARGDAMAVDSQPQPEPKQLSAHQQRYAERKQLKLKVAEMKNQKRKVVGDKFELKKQKKALAASIRNLTSQANDKTLTRTAAPPAPEPAPELPEGFAFDLPTPTQGCGHALPMQTEAWR